jgi:hypothetical protein
MLSMSVVVVVAVAASPSIFMHLVFLFSLPSSYGRFDFCCLIQDSAFFSCKTLLLQSKIR